MGISSVIITVSNQIFEIILTYCHYRGFIMIKKTALRFTNALLEGDSDTARTIVMSMVQEDVHYEEIIFNVIAPSLLSISERFLKTGELSLSQHFLSSKICDDIVTDLLGKISPIENFKSTVVLGTASGDFHGLGKKIVGGCLRTNLHRVIDLGLSVEPEKFVSVARELNAEFIAISSMMYHTATGENGPLKVREILKKESLEDNIKIIVGGAPYRFNKDLYKSIKADGWAEDAGETVKLVSELTGGQP